MTTYYKEIIMAEKNLDWNGTFENIRADRHAGGSPRQVESVDLSAEEAAVAEETAQMKASVRKNPQRWG